MNTTVEEQNEIERARRLTKLRDNARIFREVFGTPGNLTKHGKIVLDALHATFGARTIPRNILDDHGRTDMWQTARSLGHYDVIQSIYDALNWKENEHTSSTGTR